MKLTKSRLQKIIKEEFEKLISLKEKYEKPKAEIEADPEAEKARLDCERKAAVRGVPMGFNPNTGKCEMLNEE